MAKDHIRDYDTTAGNNTDVNGVNCDEGWAPENVNNALRALMADLAELHGDTRATVTTAGAGNAYTLTTNETITAYAAGGLFAFIADRANTGAATLNIDGVGAKDWVKNHDLPLIAGDIEANQICVVAYEATDDTLQLLSPSGKVEGGILTTRGDMIRAGASGVAERFALGAANTVVASDGTDADFAALTVAMMPAGLVRLNTGSYTGDGTTSQGITGVGFEPKYVRIWPRKTSAELGGDIYETTDTIVDDNASGIAWRIAVSAIESKTNAILSLDADGFTVSDQGTNSIPNENAVVYNYMAIGETT